MFEINPSRKIKKSENVKSDNNTVQQRAFLNEPQDSLELSTKKKKNNVSFGSAIHSAVSNFLNPNGISPKAVKILEQNNLLPENFEPEQNIYISDTDKFTDMPTAFQRKLAIDMYKGNPNNSNIKLNSEGKPQEIKYYDGDKLKYSEEFEYAHKQDGSPVLIKQKIYRHNNNDKTIENEISFHKHRNGAVTISSTDGRQMSYSLRKDTVRDYNNTPSIQPTQTTTQTATQTTTQPVVEEKPKELFVRPKPVYPNNEYDRYQMYKINSKFDDIKYYFLEGKDLNSRYAFQTINPVLADLEKVKSLVVGVKDKRIQTEILKLLSETKDHDLPTTYSTYTHIDIHNNYSNLIRIYNLAKISLLTQEDVVYLDEKNHFQTLANGKYIDPYCNGNESFASDDKIEIIEKLSSINLDESLTPQEKDASRQEVLNDARVHLISQYISDIPYDNQEFRQYISDNYLKPNLPEKYHSDLKALENVRGEALTLMKHTDFTYDSLKNFHELNDVAKEHFLKHKDMCRDIYLRNNSQFLVEKPYDALASLSEDEWNTFEKRNMADVLDVITGYNISTFKEKTGTNIHKAIEMSDEDWKKLNDFGLLTLGIKGDELSFEKHRNLTFDFDQALEIINNLSYKDWETAQKRGLLDIKGSRLSSATNCGNNMSVPILVATAKVPDSTFRFLNNIKLFRNNSIELPYDPEKSINNIAKGIEFLSKSHSDVYDNVSTLLDNGIEPEIAMELVGIGANNYNSFGKYLTGKVLELQEKGVKRYDLTYTLPMYVDLQSVKDKSDINELSIDEKRGLLKNLIKYNAQLFSSPKDLFDSPIIPTNKEEYCALLPKLIKSIGIDTRPVTQETINNFVSATDAMADKNGEFMNTKFTKDSPKLELEYPREQFVTNVLDKVSDLSDTEKMKVYDYFGFDLKLDKNNVMQMHGYPINVNNGKKLSAIENEQTKAVVEEVRPLVEKFSHDNKVTIDGKPEFAKQINDILELFPEFRSIIGKKQHDTHDFSVDVHTLKVLQGVMSDPRYEKLSSEDKKILNISTLLHDLTKAEGTVDKTHPAYSAYDAYHIISKMNMSEADKLKVYQIIKNHDWLEQYNGKVKTGRGEYREHTPEEKEKIAKDIAFELKDGNNFELANILTKADMKAVKETDDFFSRYEYAFNNATEKITPLVDNVQETAIHLPQTKIPKASELKVDGENIREHTYHTKDGKELKYKRINLQPDMDLGALGFEKGLNSNDLNVIVHALDEADQSATFQALGSVDSDALLSASYVNYAKGNYHVFRQQGFILDVNSADIQAGTYKDFGSGYGKDLETLKTDYLFNGERKSIRNFMSDNMKKRLNLSDKEYKKLYSEIADKSISELDESYPHIANAMRDMFREMDVHKRRYGRNYNEWLVSRPRIQGVFIQSSKYMYQDPPEFLIKYAVDNDLPVIYFGE